MKNMNGLLVVNVELSNKCNKECWMCGRRKLEKDYPDVVANYGDMDIGLVEKIASQLPDDIVVQFHYFSFLLISFRAGNTGDLWPCFCIVFQSADRVPQTFLLFPEVLSFALS